MLVGWLGLEYLICYVKPLPLRLQQDDSTRHSSSVTSIDDLLENLVFLRLTVNAAPQKLLQYTTFPKENNRIIYFISQNNKKAKMKYTTTLIALSLLLLNEVDSFSTSASSHTQQYATKSLLFQHHRRTGEGHNIIKNPFQSRASTATSTILPQHRQTTSLSMSPVPVGAIAGALTGGLLGGALHAIAGTFIVFLFTDLLLLPLHFGQTDRLSSVCYRVVSTAANFFFLKRKSAADGQKMKFGLDVPLFSNLF